MRLSRQTHSSLANLLKFIEYQKYLDTFILKIISDVGYWSAKVIKFLEMAKLMGVTEV